MSDIVIAEFMEGTGIDYLRRRFDVTYDSELYTDSGRLARQLARSRALVVRNCTLVDDSLLENAPNLVCLGRLGSGLDNIDLDACRHRNVRVYPADGANAASVGEYVVAAIMLLHRSALLGTSEMLDGKWPRQESIGLEVSGRALGVIGLGRTGREVAERAACLGMNVIGHDPHLPAEHEAWTRVRRVDLEDLLRLADVVSVHVPLLSGTRHLVDARGISRMKRGALLINASRGGIVDETALADALRTNRLGGAAIDVFEIEPLTSAAAKRFAGLRNLVLTPHIAGLTRDSGRRTGMLVASRIAEHLTSKS